MMVSLLLLAPAFFIVLLVFIVAGSRVDSIRGGGENMIKNVYLYLVLFATLMMTIGGSVGIFMATADIIAPSPYHQSFEEYRTMNIERVYPDRENRESVPPSEAELKARYDSLVAAHKERQVARATNTLIKSFGWIIIPFPVFIYFQRRLAKKED